MFEFEDDRNTHMPYVAHGEAKGDIRQLCCIRDDAGKWKIHIFDGEWRRIPTGMPEDATECSPFAEYDPKTRKWSATFIAGGSLTDRDKMRFALYRIPNLARPKAERILYADAGYYWKGLLFHGGRIGGIDIETERHRRHLELKGVEYLYRLTNNADDPAEILVTGQRPGGDVFTWAIDLRQRTVDDLQTEGQPLYKPCVIDGEWFTARRDGGFEERHIARVEKLDRMPQRWDDCIILTEEEPEEED